MSFQRRLAAILSLLCWVQGYKMGEMITCFEQNVQSPYGFKDKVYGNLTDPVCTADRSLCETYLEEDPYKGKGDVCDHTDSQTGLLRNACYFQTNFGAKINEEKTWSYKCWSMHRCPLFWTDENGDAILDEDGNAMGRQGCKVNKKRIQCCCQDSDFCNGNELIVEFAAYGHPDNYPPDFDALCALVQQPEYSDIYVSFEVDGYTHCSSDPFESGEESGDDDGDESEGGNGYGDAIEPVNDEITRASEETDASQNTKLGGDKRQLDRGERITSANGAFYATIRSDDCSLVVYDASDGVVWEPTLFLAAENLNRENLETCQLSMQGDNNLVIYWREVGAAAWTAVWSSRTCNQGESWTSECELTDEGYLQVTDGSGELLWTSQAVYGAAAAQNSSSSESEEIDALLSAIHTFGDVANAKQSVNASDILLVFSFFIVALCCVAIGVWIGSKCYAQQTVQKDRQHDLDSVDMDM